MKLTDPAKQLQVGMKLRFTPIGVNTGNTYIVVTDIDFNDPMYPGSIGYDRYHDTGESHSGGWRVSINKLYGGEILEYPFIPTADNVGETVICHDGASRSYFEIAAVVDGTVFGWWVESGERNSPGARSVSGYRWAKVEPITGGFRVGLPGETVFWNGHFVVLDEKSKSPVWVVDNPVAVR